MLLCEVFESLRTRTCQPGADDVDDRTTSHRWLFLLLFYHFGFALSPCVESVGLGVWIGVYIVYLASALVE